MRYAWEDGLHYWQSAPLEMVVYKFFLCPKGTNENHSYEIDLKPEDEDRPETFFRDEIRDRLQTRLQTQSQCAISAAHLEKIVATWCEDIRLGYRESRLTLKLPLLVEANLHRLHEPGNQDLPAPMAPNLEGVEPQGGRFPPLETIFATDSLSRNSAPL